MSKELDISYVIANYKEKKEISDAPTEEHMKNVLQKYIDSINNHDAEAILSLFADDMVIADPVGTKPLAGLEAIAPFIRRTAPTAIKAELSSPIRTSPDKTAAMALTIHSKLGEAEIIIEAIEVMKFNEEGKIVENKAYWGKDNIKVLKK